ncbi:MAG: M14 family zinc carboxypeptidase, partial [Candidatus Cloacimonadaceae bacterium]
MKKTLLVLLLFLLSLTLQGYPVKITSWQIKEDVKKLNRMNVSVDYVNQETQTIIAYVPDDYAFSKILSNGFAAIRIPDYAKEYADSLWEATKYSDDPMRDYYTWSEFTTFMQNTANQFPNICELVQFGTSVQNRPLYFMKISDNVAQQENEPEFRYISSIHGDEVVGYDLLIRLIQQLTSQYGTDPRVTIMVDNTELWICPMLNPDGYIAHSRYNANLVDLNRNFPMPVGSLHP